MSEQASDASHEAHFGWWEEGDMSSTHHVVHGTASSIEALKAREAKLRKALKAIADPRTPDNLGLPESRLYLVQQIARAALAASPEEVSRD